MAGHTANDSGVRATLKDVARVAGVSTFTVSRTLNADGRGVSAETRERVEDVAKRLGYQANPFARSLRSGASNAIAVLTANRKNLFYADLINALERELRDDGFTFLVSDAVVDGEFVAEREESFVSEAIAHHVHAAVFTYQPAVSRLERLRSEGIPCIFIDVPAPEGFESLPSVRGDSRSGAALLAEHLLSHGYLGPWLFAGLPERWSSVAERRAGFLTTANAAGIEVDEVEATNEPAQTAHIMSDALAPRMKPGGRLPRVIFAANEMVLQGTLAALRERSLRIPHDVAVVSYDDFDWAEYLDPSITVIDQNLPALAQRAASLILSARRGSDSASPASHTAAQELVPPELRARASCGCPAS